MKGTKLTARWNIVLSTTLGLLTAAFVIFVLAEIRAPFVSGDKANLITLFILGIFLCIKGNTHSAMMFGWTNPAYWTNPISIAGMVLGVLALLIFAFIIGGINIPLIKGYREASLVLAIVIFIKIGLKILQNRIINIKT